MSTPHDHPPSVLADGDGFTITQAPEAVGQRMHVLAKATKARAVHVQRFFAPSYLPVEADGVVRGLAAGVGHQGAAGQVFKPSHPQPALELACEPAGHAHVIGVHVGAEDAGDARALRRGGQRALGRNQLAPSGQRLGCLGAGINHRPAGPKLVFVGQRPQVDVVQGKRQVHAYPQHPGRHFLHHARSRWLATGVLQGVGRLGFACRPRRFVGAAIGGGSF
jgi:hypothetical protein